MTYVCGNRVTVALMGTKWWKAEDAQESHRSFRCGRKWFSTCTAKYLKSDNKSELLSCPVSPLLLASTVPVVTTFSLRFLMTARIVSDLVSI